jgi:hypothetical protein
MPWPRPWRVGIWMLWLSVTLSSFGCGRKYVYLLDSDQPTLLKRGNAAQEDLVCLQPGAYLRVFRGCLDKTFEESLQPPTPPQ